MKIELSGKEFTLRADFLALKKAKDEAGIQLNQLSDDPVEAGTLLYYIAQSGHKFAGIPFKHSLEDFLGLIDMTDVPAMSEALSALVSSGSEKKS
jgi:hypothetical protein